MLTADNEILSVKKERTFLPDVSPSKPRLINVTSASLVRQRVDKSLLGPNGHWRFDVKMHSGGHVGFVYLIHDLVTDMMYIGKKHYAGAGKKNKGVTSNWMWYTSSCAALAESIKVNGKDQFIYYVLDEYVMRGSLGFAETWSLMAVQAPANRDKWYNMLVNKVSWRVKESISEKHKFRLSEIIQGRGLQLENLI